MGARDAALLLLLYGAGLRIGEALSLNRADVGKDPRTLRSLRVVGKGSKERLVPVLPVVAEALAAYLLACPLSPLPHEPLFRGVRGGRLQQGVVQKLVRQLRVGLGLPETATPHALRHSFATHLLGSGRRSARHPGAAGARQPVHDPGLYRSGRAPPPGALRAGASSSVTLSEQA